MQDGRDELTIQDFLIGCMLACRLNKLSNSEQSSIEKIEKLDKRYFTYLLPARDLELFEKDSSLKVHVLLRKLLGKKSDTQNFTEFVAKCIEAHEEQVRLDEELDLTNMPIATVLRDWMISEGWKDEMEISEDGNYATVSAIFSINDQEHRLYLETNEKNDLFAIFLYSPFNIPAARRSEIIDIINRVHGKLLFGRFWCPTGDKTQELQFRTIIDVEGSSLSTKQVDLMLSSAIQAFRDYGPVFTRVAMTNEPAETAWSDFESAQEVTREDDDESLGPAQI